jgi:DNA-binding XRE family transcriptional regulator
MTDSANTTSERLKIICETFFGGNKSKMAKVLDVSYQNINNYIERGKKPSFEVMQKIYSVFKDRINPEWLFLGENEMQMSIPKQDDSAHTAIDNNSELGINSIINPELHYRLSNEKEKIKTSFNYDKTIFDYQSHIIELQQRLIRSLDK